MPTYRQSEPKAHGSLLPPGNYDADITDAVLKYSKSGNEMIKMVVSINDHRGSAEIQDNLVFVESSYWKIDKVLASIGHKIVPGTDLEVTPRMLINRRGRVKIVNVAGDKPGVMFNEIDTWLLPAENPAPSPAREPANTSVANRLPGRNGPARTPAYQDDEDCIPF